MRIRSIRTSLTVAVISTALAWMAQADSHGMKTRSPAGAHLKILTPKNGATVKSPFVVAFGLSGMGVAPAGVEHANTGHHHLIIDSPLPDLRFAVPKDEKHLHFGGGQTQVEVSLPPGQHTLQLLLGDHNHIPHDPPVMSEQITITVE